MKKISVKRYILSNTKEFIEILWNLFALRLVKGMILILM
jgi:hypothetical protein